MATYDDRQWILSLIQNAYVTTDDTGISEVVLQDNLNVALRHVSEYSFQDKLYEEFHTQDESDHSSPDITTDSHFTSHRHRSYTERKSEKLKREREKASRIRKIQWRCNEDSLTEDILSETFQRKLVVTRSSDTSCGEPPPKQVSLFSHLLQSCSDVNTNPFIEFAKFDGVTHNTGARKQFKIFIYIGSKPCLDYPLRVTVVCSARVCDLIGLIAWLYTRENSDVELKTVDQYQLHIAEDDGTVDWEFQPLEKRDCIEKYGFTTLALVEKEEKEDTKGIIVTVNFARGEFSKIVLENEDATLEEVLKKSVSRRKDITKLKEAGINYHLEREDAPGIALKLDKSVGQVQCMEFAAVRDNSKRMEVRMEAAPTPVEITQPETFRVIWEKKIAKFDAKLFISGEVLEIFPIQLRGSSSIFVARTPLPVTYRLDQLLECHKRALRKDRLEVTLTVRGDHSFKIYKLICDQAVGFDIYVKCSHLIRLNSSKIALKRPVMRRHNSLSFRKKIKSDQCPYEV